MTPTILWGTLGPDSSSIDTAAERTVNKTQSLVHMAISWAYGRKADGTPAYAPFPAAMLQPAYARNSLVVLDWASWDLQNQKDPAFGLDTILAGKHDQFVHTWAQAAATFARPILLRFDAEMNGNWWAYGAQPNNFVAVWKKLRAIFAAEHATNVSWFWCPNVTAPLLTAWPTAADRLPFYYPGDDQVEWTGFDTYNWYTANGGPWMTFDEIMNGYPGWLGPTYEAIAKFAPKKPMCLGEFGCWDDARKPLWLVDALANLPTHYPLVRAISYFNWDAGDGSKWPLSGDSYAAFKAAIGSPVFLPAAWMPEDKKPFGAPPLNVTAAPDVPAELRTLGASWDQVALSLAGSLKQVTSQANDAASAAAKAQAELTTIQSSLQTLFRAGGGQVAA